MKVLVIDDERGNLNMFRLLLRAYGYEALVAENGAAALEIAEKEKPPIVFTDIKMPGMDGLEVLKRLKSLEPHCEVIVMTGHGDMELAVQALNLDATDFINKPIQRSALEAALARAEERLRQSGAQENRIRVHRQGAVTVLEIAGSVTSRSEAMLMDAYREATGQGADRILLQFEETASINGAGIGLLIQMLTESKSRKQRVGVTGISENLAKIFDMVGISRLATVFDGQQTALDAFNANDPSA